MGAPVDPSRRPDLDDEVDGLDCFASEGAEVIDTADDAQTIAEAGSWRSGPIGDFALKSAIVGLILVMLGVAIQNLKQPAVPSSPQVAVATIPQPAARPVSAPIAVPAPAPAIEPRETKPVLAPPVVAQPAPRVAVAPPALAPRATPTPRPARAESTVPSDAIARTAAAPSATIENPVVIATPEVVRAEPAPDTPRVAPAVAVITPPNDRASIERVLAAYRDAYDRLDAPSAAVIWPRVDTRALSRAFSSLAQQDLSFDACDLDIAGAQARARCVGEIRYVRRVGDPAPRVRRLSWSFALERVSDRWQIAQVTAD